MPRDDDLIARLDGCDELGQTILEFGNGDVAHEKAPILARILARIRAIVHHRGVFTCGPVWKKLLIG